MELAKNGAFIKNRTSKYLAYSLYEYDPTLPILFKRLNIRGFGIGDMFIDDFDSIYRPHIYALCATKGYVNNVGEYVNEKFYLHRFNEALDYLRSTSMLAFDYEFLQKEDYHMIVFNLPKEKEYIKSLFIDGKYSLMYDKDEHSKYEISSHIVDILTKNENCLPTYLDNLNREFNGLSLSIKDVKDHDEYDVKPFLKDEIFNYDLLNVGNEEEGFGKD